jgi:hypothetical protein
MNVREADALEVAAAQPTYQVVASDRDAFARIGHIEFSEPKGV